MYDKHEYAIKIFPSRSAFDVERALRDKLTLAAVLPLAPLVHDPQEAGELRADVRGRVLAPCIVMPRGESLHAWSQRARPDVFLAATVRLPRGIAHACRRVQCRPGHLFQFTCGRCSARA